MLANDWIRKDMQNPASLPKGAPAAHMLKHTAAGSACRALVRLQLGEHVVDGAPNQVAHAPNLQQTHVQSQCAGGRSCIPVCRHARGTF